MKINARMILGGLLVCLALASTGCYQSPRQKLMGRWYNGDMSLRFRPDGIVLFNNLDGMASGRYFFTEDRPSGGSAGVRQNLLLDVVRNGKRQHYAFDATFLADDRLRLVEVPLQAVTERPTDEIRQFALLRKAAEDTVATATAAR
ncbi:hypothetical protein GC163_17885 [bacterium]|nr:hypothetical protein [bacterium]